MSYNGSAVIAMVGKECVAIAADRRFGVQAQTVTVDFQKIFSVRLYAGLPGRSVVAGLRCSQSADAARVFRTMLLSLAAICIADSAAWARISRPCMRLPLLLLARRAGH